MNQLFNSRSLISPERVMTVADKVGISFVGCDLGASMTRNLSLFPTHLKIPIPDNPIPNNEKITKLFPNGWARIAKRINTMLQKANVTVIFI